MLWLATVVLVPLAFLGRDHGEWSSIIGSFELPKLVILRTLVGLMAGLWAIEWGLQGWLSIGVPFNRERQWARPRRWIGLLRSWLRGNPVRWLKLAVVFFLASTLLSTFLSVSFSVSMWGDVPGQDSYSGHTVVAYILLFTVIATHLKSEAQLWRLMGALVLAGILVAGYGILQQYGQDFLNLIEPPNTKRISSTLGNATFAASVMLMTIPISLAAATLTLKGSWRGFSYWGKLGLLLTILTVQLLGLAFTLSRGPWLGTTVALVGFLSLLGIFVGWRSFAKAGVLLGSAIAVTTIVLFATTQPGSRTDETTASVVTDRLSTVNNTSAAGGLKGRQRIWESSWQLMTDHTWFEFDSLSLSSLRPLIGYGPDLFRTAYFLETRPNPAQDLLPNEVAQAHNYFIHQGVELGFLGLITSLGVFVAFFTGGGYVLYRSRQRFAPMYKLVLVALMATLAGRLVEQLFGVARVSDLTLSWVLLAFFAALIPIMDKIDAAQYPEHRSPRQRRPQSQQSDPVARFRAHPWRWLFTLRLVFVATLVAGITLLVLSKNINYFRAAIDADDGAAQLGAGNLRGAQTSLDQAIGLAPDVSSYYERRAYLYSNYSDQELAGENPGCLFGPNNLSPELCLAEEAHTRNLEWLGQRPFQFRSRLASAESAMALGTIKGDAGKVSESLRLYSEAQSMVPNSWPLANRVAQVHIDAGRPADALVFLDRSLEITKDTVNSVQALLLRSRAFETLDQPQRVIADLSRAIELDSASAEAHYNRGRIHYRLGRFDKAKEDFDNAIQLDQLFTLAYNDRGLTFARLGKLPLAVEDFRKAIHLDPEYAPAYNNRGFTYRDLGQLDQAILDLNEAIRLNPKLATTYYNRALTHLLLGNDEEAERDGQAAVELGFDPIALEEAMRITRRGR